jgi:betaine reductase
MQKKSLKIVYYLNQFFGGIGGEDKADVGPRVKEGPVGPGRVAQQALGNNGNIIATVICGDNYFTEKIEAATEEVIKLVTTFEPDVLIAGPAFFAGRYAIACGAVCKTAGDRLGIPALTGMYRENPAVDLYRKDVYIVETESSAKKMAEVVSKMVGMGIRLARGQKIGRPSEEGYFARGILINEASEYSSAERAVSMLLAKVTGRPFESEVPLPDYESVPPAAALKDLQASTIALVTDGGLVPKGNPDRIEPERATKYGRYSIEGVDRLNPENYQVHHAGYTPVFVDRDPNRLLPVDVMRDLEAEGLIGKLHPLFYSTSGCASILSIVRTMGQSIAEELKASGVQAAILTST